jgi:signal transduction histidine kinase/DNA-binding LacI/PurR family transcriptional regulator/AraC-like DNA-binding protein
MPDKPRPTIGYLTTGVGPGVGLAIWSGIVDAALQQGANLFTFVGGALRDPVVFGSQANILYDLATARHADGLVIWGSSIGGFVDPAEIAALCQRYAPLPVVNLTLPMPGIPTSVIDSYRGMRDLVMHLIETHGYGRLAFIRGPETHYYAQERYRAYGDVLSQAGLALDPQRVTPPLDWSQAAGDEAVRLLVDERRLRPGVDFDALVAANDGLALGAIEALQKRGIRVPQHLAVVGFNDSQGGRASTPPLTSVALPFHQQGQQSVQMLLELVQGQPVPEQVTLLPRLVVRQSCGCPDPEVVSAAADGPHDTAHSLSALAAQRESLLADVTQAMAALPADAAAHWSERLVDAFLAELQGHSSGSCLQELEAALAQAEDRSDVSAWQGIVSALRQRAVASLDRLSLRRAENVCQQARVVIGKRAHRIQAQLSLQTEHQATVLREMGAALTTAADLPGLMDVLAEGLPRLGIPSAYLALYEDAEAWQYPQPAPEWCRLMLGYDLDGRVELEPGGRRFRSTELLPAEMLPRQRQYSFVVVPLHFRDRQLGFAILETGPRDGTVYEALRVQVSSALQGVQLLAQNVTLYHQALQAEQAAEEGRRSAEEADSLKSRFLSMVSHELLTPLVLLVGLSEMMLKEEDASQTPLPESYRQDLMRMYTSAQHLGSLVRDVLDLTRSQVGELRLALKPLDLSKTLQSVALVGEEMARTKGLTWDSEIPAQLPTVLGDAARLQQITLNLVTNAVKFTPQGYVQLQASADEQNVTVRVCDSGLGVPLAEQEAIFDEFRQSERTATRGYGGLGIGLAICRQLIHLHRGRIGVESSGEENGGSTFYFTLPILREETVVAASEASLSRVLIVAQRAADGSFLREQLARQGFEVQVLGIEETPQWKSGLLDAPPGAIVFDSRASELGWDITAALKENPTTQDIPVLLCAIQPDSDGGAMLALDSLSKPVRPEGLAQALQRYGLTADQGQGKTILVVDDDPHILELHTRLVQNALPQCRLLQAANGRIALDKMQQVPPALVLLDLMMPELDGFGVLQAMQADERLRRVPVIVLTAQTLTQRDMTRLSQGVVAVLGKGLFSVEETMAHIEQALSLNKRLGSETRRTVRKTMAYIHEHYAEALGRDDLAAVAAVSTRHLNRCFAEQMGISPLTYLQRYRVAQAKRLLEVSDQGITEIALAVGFSSSSYFAETFRRETGISASEYRRRSGMPSTLP